MFFEELQESRIDTNFTIEWRSEIIVFLRKSSHGVLFFQWKFVSSILNEEKKREIKQSIKGLLM